MQIHRYSEDKKKFPENLVIPPANSVCGGVYCFHIRPSIRVSIRDSLVFSSPLPLGSQGELIVYPYSGVRCRLRCRRRRQQCLNIFSSETALPIKAKFYVEPTWEEGTKVCINGPGHMTKMAAMPLYGKNL